MRYVLVFFATMATDWVWGLYIAHTAHRNAWRATISSGVLLLAGAFVVTSYVQDLWVLIPATLGGMIGTWISVRFSHPQAKP